MQGQTPSATRVLVLVRRISGLSYASLACFGIEYITLFLGISMFFHRVMSINILCHFAGLILVILFYNSVSCRPHAEALRRTLQQLGSASMDGNALHAGRSLGCLAAALNWSGAPIGHQLMICFCVAWRLQNWSVDSYIAFFVVFSAFPAMLEVVTVIFAMRFSFLKY